MVATSDLFQGSAYSLFAISVAQSLASQSVTVSGTTGTGGSHSHTVDGGSHNHQINITKTCCGSNPYSTNTRAYFCNGDYAATTINAKNTAKDDGHTHTCSTVNAHSHSFSKAVAIGSGSYTRPNSRSTIYIIKY